MPQAEPIRPPSKPEPVARKLRNAHANVVEILARRIIDGVYPQGAQVPAVEALAEEFNLSRTVVREAMRVLSAKGLVAARQRAGTHVRPRSDWSLLDNSVLRWLFTGAHEQDLGDSLLVLRRILEPEAAALAAQHAGRRDIEALESAYARMRKSLPIDMEECCRADVDFHIALFAATGNVFLEQFANIIRTALLITFETSTRLADSHAESMSLHGVIVEDVRAGNPAKARADMTALLSIADKHLHRGSPAGAA